MKTAKQMRQFLEQNGILVMPGAGDAMTAKIIENTGFPGVYLPRSGVFYQLTGNPYKGHITLKEMTNVISYITGAVSIPVIPETDTGDNGELVISNTVTEYEKAGAAGIQIDDMILPGKNGWPKEKLVISREDAVVRVKEALSSRTDPDFIIVARTDAREVYGLDEALKRAGEFSEAGADVIFVEAPYSVNEMEKIIFNIDKPLLANIREGGKTPLLSAFELERIGYKIVIFPHSTTRRIACALSRLLEGLKRSGTTEGFLDKMINFDELNKFLNTEQTGNN